MMPAPSQLATIPGPHRLVLAEALRAPSAHNAQPWRLAARPGGCYELHYDHLDYLPYDPDDRDAYLAIGAFLETLELAAQRHGLRATLTPRFHRRGSDLLVGSVQLRERRRGEPADPLAGPAANRRTNRHPYDRTPLPGPLRAELLRLGCALVPPRETARLVARASMLSWKDPRFVADLDRWTSADPAAPAGMTPAGLPLTRFEWAALRLAIRAGRLVQFGQRVLHMVLHGAVGQHQPPGDLLVGQAGGHHPEDLRFPLGELGSGRRAGWTAGRRAGREPPELTEDQAGQARGEHGVARRGAADRIEELGPGRGLQQVPGRAGLDRVEHVLLLTAGRQDEHPGRGPGLQQPPGDLHSGRVRQAQVEDHHVRPGGADHAQRLRAVVRRGGHLEAGLAEVAGHRITPHRMVIDDHDPDPRFRHNRHPKACPVGPAQVSWR